ncbi:tetratricopeptide repeat protein [Mucilaginibacter sp. HMF5004]|uniref:tetratricopeptide repeat protein n=1 Tax=Mucilaginibacter rivuli TaxID=2857527 RepID=UPI001C5EE4D8|nr:tetratricopeptide repeat protein [Mucilaginibacter rivuli]MBW4890595.1 tetratricopeptide repeat protein [Mucilaginibacter rivuli]
MVRAKHYVISLSVLFISLQATAQQDQAFDYYRVYHSATDLMDKGAYAGAIEQFRLLEKSAIRTGSQPAFESQLSLIKENAQYYEAFCALQLNNDDAEGLLLKFIKEHPENPLTKLAFFQVGKSYFQREDYPASLVWFNKVEAGELSGAINTEYKFRKGYALFATNDYKDAQILFGEVKNKVSPFTEDATYYFAYIAYLNKDYSIALLNFEKLKNSKKYEASYPYYITAVYFLDHRYDDVITYAIPILNSTKQLYETEMLHLVAASYFAKKDYQNAASYYTRFQDLDLGKTQNTQDSYQIGYANYKIANYPKASKELQKLIDKKDIYSQNGSYTLGDVFLKTNNKQSARSAFLVASKLDFDPQLKEDALYEYAKLSYELNFNSQALDATRLYLNTYPRSAKLNEVKTLLAEELLNSHNYREAIDILEALPSMSASAKEAYQKVTYYRGLEFYNERAFENAQGLFMRSLKYNIDPKITAYATYWMAEAMFEMRKYTESIASFENFLQIPAAKTLPVYNYANYALAYAAFNGEQYKKAANYFEKFLDGDEKDKNTVKDATIRVADSYFVLKSYTKAMEYYNRIIAAHEQGEDYALFQRGMIQGLQGALDTRINTMNSLLSTFPNSNYADDAAFEIGYAYFLKSDGETSKTKLMALIDKYPRSSYIPRALVTMGLIDYNADKDDVAVQSFKRVVAEYPSTDEAKQALKQIEKIYTDKGDAQTFITYAATTPIGNYTSAEQESIMNTAANNLYLRGDWAGTVAAVNAYFDKFPKAIFDKQGKFMRAQSLVALKRPDEAIPDYNYILNDWTSAYTEKSLISMSQIYLAQKKYNEAVTFLKRLEVNSEYEADRTFALNNLMLCYAEMEMPDDALKYVELVRENTKTSEEDKFRSSLFAGKAYLLKADTTAGLKELNEVVSGTKTIAAAEAKYNIANVEYRKRNYKASQKTCFDLINKLSSYDYWVAKTYILLADNYVGLKDTFQAKATLQSIIDNYKADDDILPSAKAKLDALSPAPEVKKDDNKPTKQ